MWALNNNALGSQVYNSLLIGKAVVMPSLVKIFQCEPPPSSNDIPYFELWKEEWKNLDFDQIKKTWLKQ